MQVHSFFLRLVLVSIAEAICLPLVVLSCVHQPLHPSPTLPPEPRCATRPIPSAQSHSCSVMEVERSLMELRPAPQLPTHLMLCFLTSTQ